MLCFHHHNAYYLFSTTRITHLMHKQVACGLDIEQMSYGGVQGHSMLFEDDWKT